MKKGDLLYFDAVDAAALQLATILRTRKEELLQVLTRYETYKTAEDEIQRSLDLLENLHENEQYFTRVVGPIATFMPSNQPLYSFTCFAVVPALMSERVCVKPPEIMTGFYEDMLSILKIDDQPFTIEYMTCPRNECVELFTATEINKETGLEQPKFEAVIFTGTSKNADKLRPRFHKSVLFIANGAGHNPLVITETADVDSAIDSVMSVCTYNQGQDCAAPNAILVHAKRYDEVLKKLRTAVADLQIGAYDSPKTDIGPISRPDTLHTVAEFLTQNRHYLDTSTEGVVRVQSHIVEPTIVAKPLRDGANFEEVFAPILIIQKYDDDQDLNLYFTDDRYAHNAMYITVYGKSDFIEQFVTEDEAGMRLHNSSTVLYDTDLHKPGVERGVLPYGGYGRGASCVSINGSLASQPTLPQRELFAYLVQKKDLKNTSVHGAIAASNHVPLASAGSRTTSSSLALEELVKIYEPEMLRWLFARGYSIFALYESIHTDFIRLYDEYDKTLQAFQSGGATIVEAALLQLAGARTTPKEYPMPVKLLLTMGQNVHWNTEKLKKLLRYRAGRYASASIDSRLPRVHYWLENYSENRIIALREHRNTTYMQAMSKKDLSYIRALHLFLLSGREKSISLARLERKLYDLPKSKNLSKRQLVQAQGALCKNLYNLLIGLDAGPRLAAYIWAADQTKIIQLLDTKDFYAAE